MALDDEVRALCAKAAASSDEEEVRQILEQLRSLLKVHRDQIKDLAAAHSRLWDGLKRD